MNETAYPDSQNRPFRLTTEEMNNPRRVFHNFFTSYTLVDCRLQQWEMQMAAFCRNPEQGWDGVDIGDLMYYYRQVEELIEAAFLLYKKWEAKEAARNTG